MGWDLVSFLNGERNTSLVHAIKASSEYVYGEEFGQHLATLGYASRLVMNEVEGYQEADRWQIAPQATVPLIKMPTLLQLRYHPFRGEKTGRPVFGGYLREIKPRLDDDMIRQLAGHLLWNCQAHDALTIQDYRSLPPKPLGGY